MSTLGFPLLTRHTIHLATDESNTRSLMPPLSPCLLISLTHSWALLRHHRFVVVRSFFLLTQETTGPRPSRLAAALVDWRSSTGAHPASTFFLR
jgi:hypothetical protein